MGAEVRPFGQELDAQTTSNHYKFTGKERDAESGLDYFGARYYASSMGRWMSPDWAAKPEAVPYSKLDDPQTLNLYGYVRNNPLWKPDIDGHGWWSDQFKQLAQDVKTAVNHATSTVQWGTGLNVGTHLGKVVDVGVGFTSHTEATNDHTNAVDKGEVHAGIKVLGVGPSVEAGLKATVDPNGKTGDYTPYLETSVKGGSGAGSVDVGTDKVSVGASLYVVVGGGMQVNYDKGEVKQVMHDLGQMASQLLPKSPPPPEENQ